MIKSGEDRHMRSKCVNVKQTMRNFDSLSSEHIGRGVIQAGSGNKKLGRKDGS